MLTTVLVVSIIFCIRPELNTVSKAQFKKHWVPLIVLALLYTISICTSNASLSELSLPVTYMIMFATPVPTLVLSYYLERKTYVYSVTCLVVLQVIAAVVAVPNTGYVASSYGVFLALCSVVTAAAKPVLAGILMHDRNETGLTPLALVWYYTLIGMFCMLLIFLVSSERSYMYIQLASSAWRSSVAIVFGSLLASAYNILMFYLTMYTSALTNTVLGNVKQVIVILITYCIVEVGDFAMVNVVGILAAFVLSCAYGYVLAAGSGWSWRSEEGLPTTGVGSKASENTPLTEEAPKDTCSWW